MKKLRQFFSPVEKPHQAAGLTFNQFFFGQGENFGLAIFIMAFQAVLFLGMDEHDELGGRIFAHSFTAIISVTHLFMVLRHWNDLKNGRSR